MDAGHGEIVLHRSKSFRDRFRKYKVVLDGETVGRVSAGEEKTFPVAAGDHELQLKIDWKGSDVLRVRVSEGERSHFACGGKNIARAVPDLLNSPEAWIQLEALND